MRMSMRQFIQDGQRYPLGYGFAYFEPYRDVAVCYPIPFNWIVGAARKVWFRLQQGPSDQLIAAFDRVRQAAWDSGYKVGRRDGLEDGYHRRKEHIQAIDTVIFEIWKKEAR